MSIISGIIIFVNLFLQLNNSIIINWHTGNKGTIVFPVAFTSSNYAVVSVPISVSGYAQIQNKKLTGCTLGCSNGNTTDSIAIGY